MREIKFRVWGEQDKCMYYSDDWYIYEIRIEMNGTPHLVDPHQPEIIKNDCTPSFILMQYTWLKDKNGKEVCEWDIVQPYYQSNWEKIPTLSIVEYKDNGFWMKDLIDLWFNSNWYYNFEVIWNIYENADLLSNKQ